MANSKKGLATPIWIVIAVAALAVGVLLGHFVIGGGGAVSLSGKTTISEGDLDSPIASYTYDGKTTNVSAREVIEQSSSLDAAKQDDGTYAVPSADDVLAYARNAIVLQVASDQGLSVSDEERDQYAQDMLQTTDYATVAANYGIPEDTVKKIVSDSALMKKLRDSVVTTELPTMPDAPTAPDDGNTDTATQDYATYVISLLGDEWDATNNTWARTDGSYYAALSSYPISNESATYAAAQAAYYVAYSNYSTASSQVSSEWTTYVNTLFSKASIQIESLQA